LVRITVKDRVRDRVRGRIRVRDRVRDSVRDRVRFRDRRSEPDRRSEAINFGANSDRRSEPNTSPVTISLFPTSIDLDPIFDKDRDLDRFRFSLQGGMVSLSC